MGKSEDGDVVRGFVVPVAQRRKTKKARKKQDVNIKDGTPWLMASVSRLFIGRESRLRRRILRVAVGLALAGLFVPFILVDGGHEVNKLLPFFVRHWWGGWFIIVGE